MGKVKGVSGNTTGGVSKIKSTATLSRNKHRLIASLSDRTKKALQQRHQKKETNVAGNGKELRRQRSRGEKVAFPNHPQAEEGKGSSDTAVLVSVKDNNNQTGDQTSKHEEASIQYVEPSDLKKGESEAEKYPGHVVNMEIKHTPIEQQNVMSENRDKSSVVDKYNAVKLGGKDACVIDKDDVLSSQYTLNSKTMQDYTTESTPHTKFEDFPPGLEKNRMSPLEPKVNEHDPLCLHQLEKVTTDAGSYCLESTKVIPLSEKFDVSPKVSSESTSVIGNKEKHFLQGIVTMDGGIGLLNQQVSRVLEEEKDKEYNNKDENVAASCGMLSLSHDSEVSPERPMLKSQIDNHSNEQGCQSADTCNLDQNVASDLTGSSALSHSSEFSKPINFRHAVESTELINNAILSLPLNCETILGTKELQTDQPSNFGDEMGKETSVGIHEDSTEAQTVSSRDEVVTSILQQLRSNEDDHVKADTKSIENKIDEIIEEDNFHSKSRERSSDSTNILEKRQEEKQSLPADYLASSPGSRNMGNEDDVQAQLTSLEKSVKTSLMDNSVDDPSGFQWKESNVSCESACTEYIAPTSPFKESSFLSYSFETTSDAPNEEHPNDVFADNKEKQVSDKDSSHIDQNGSVINSDAQNNGLMSHNEVKNEMKPQNNDLKVYDKIGHVPEEHNKLLKSDFEDLEEYVPAKISPEHSGFSNALEEKTEIMEYIPTNITSDHGQCQLVEKRAEEMMEYVPTKIEREDSGDMSNTLTVEKEDADVPGEVGSKDLSHTIKTEKKGEGVPESEYITDLSSTVKTQSDDKGLSVEVKSDNGNSLSSTVKTQEEEESVPVERKSEDGTDLSSTVKTEEKDQHAPMEMSECEASISSYGVKRTSVSECNSVDFDNVQTELKVFSPRAEEAGKMEDTEAADVKCEYFNPQLTKSEGDKKQNTFGDPVSSCDMKIELSHSAKRDAKKKSNSFDVIAGTKVDVNSALTLVGNSLSEGNGVEEVLVMLKETVKAVKKELKSTLTKNQQDTDILNTPVQSYAPESRFDKKGDSVLAKRLNDSDEYNSKGLPDQSKSNPNNSKVSAKLSASAENSVASEMACEKSKDFESPRHLKTAEMVSVNHKNKNKDDGCERLKDDSSLLQVPSKTKKHKRDDSKSAAGKSKDSGVVISKQKVHSSSIPSEHSYHKHPENKNHSANKKDSQNPPKHDRHKHKHKHHHHEKETPESEKGKHTPIKMTFKADSQDGDNTCYHIEKAQAMSPAKLPNDLLIASQHQEKNKDHLSDMKHGVKLKFAQENSESALNNASKKLPNTISSFPHAGVKNKTLPGNSLSVVKKHKLDSEESPGRPVKKQKTCSVTPRKNKIVVPKGISPVVKRKLEDQDLGIGKKPKLDLIDEKRFLHPNGKDGIASAGLKSRMDLDHRARLYMKSASDSEFGHLIHVETHPNGGASVVHCYQDELKHLQPDKLKQFVKEYFDIVYGEREEGVPNHVMGIVHGSATYLPDLIEYFAINHPNLTVKSEVLGKVEIETTSMEKYTESVHSTYKNGTYRFGPLMQVSMFIW